MISRLEAVSNILLLLVQPPEILLYELAIWQASLLDEYITEKIRVR